MAKQQKAKVTDFTPDSKNANKGTERGRSLLEKSLRELGAGRSILADKHGNLIAGNKTAEVAGEIGLDEAIVVETNGHQVVVVKRMDLDLGEDEKARTLAYMDNRVGELDLEWDIEQLLEDKEQGVALPWTDVELGKMFQTEGEDPYSNKVNTPTYEPSEEKPMVGELFDNTYAKQLIADIRGSSIPKAEKDFLILAAGRHVKLDFEQIADYYAHSNKEMQELMEDNALVIVDFDKAIEKGWVKLSVKMDAQFEEENEG
jgi:hypothetical protein